MSANGRQSQLGQGSSGRAVSQVCGCWGYGAEAQWGHSEAGGRQCPGFCGFYTMGSLPTSHTPSPRFSGT